MEFLNCLNFTESKKPEKGDVLVIETKKRKGKRILAHVKDVTSDNEVILQSSTNSFYNHGMYEGGESWVWRVWNLGKIELTTSVNNFDNIYYK